jgi:hypothetical protein
MGGQGGWPWAVLGVLLILWSVRKVIFAVAPGTRPRPTVAPDAAAPAIADPLTRRQWRTWWGVGYAGGMTGLAAWLGARLQIDVELVVLFVLFAVVLAGVGVYRPRAGGIAFLAAWAAWSVALLADLEARHFRLSLIVLALPVPVWPGPFLHLGLLFLSADTVNPAVQRWQLALLLALPALMWILVALTFGAGATG